MRPSRSRSTARPCRGPTTSARRSIPASRRLRSSGMTSAALEAALASGEIACVLAEPAMTNIGIVLPDPGYHDALRALTREHDTLLVIDETHTICAGPGGYTAANRTRPRLPHDRQAARRRGAGRRLRDERRGRRPRARAQRPARGLRRRRHRRYALGQRALAGGDAGHARERPDRGGLRADDRPRRAFRGGGRRGDRVPRTALARDPARLSRRVRVQPRGAAERRRGCGGRRTATSTASSTSTPSTAAC